MDNIVFLNDFPSDILRNSIFNGLPLPCVFRLSLTNKFWRDDSWTYITSLEIHLSTESKSIPETAVTNLSLCRMLLHVSSVKLLSNEYKVPKSYAQAFGNLILACGKSLESLHMDNGRLKRLVPEKFLSRFGRRLQHFSYLGLNNGKKLEPSIVPSIAKHCPNLKSFAIQAPYKVVPIISNFMRDLRDLTVITPEVLDDFGSVQLFPHLTRLEMYYRPQALLHHIIGCKDFEVIQTALDNIKEMLPPGVALNQFYLDKECVFDYLVRVVADSVETLEQLESVYGYVEPKKFSHRCCRMKDAIEDGDFDLFLHHASRCEPAETLDQVAGQHQVIVRILKYARSCEDIERAKQIISITLNLVPANARTTFAPDLLAERFLASPPEHIHKLLSFDDEFSLGIRAELARPSSKYLLKMLDECRYTESPTFLERIGILTSNGATIPSTLENSDFQSLSNKSRLQYTRLFELFPDIFSADKWPELYSSALILNSLRKHSELLSHFLRCYRSVDRFVLPYDWKKELAITAIRSTFDFLEPFEFLQKEFGIDNCIALALQSKVTTAQEEQMVRFIHRLISTAPAQDDARLASFLSQIESMKVIRPAIWESNRRAMKRKSKNLPLCTEVVTKAASAAPN